MRQSFLRCNTENTIHKTKLINWTLPELKLRSLKNTVKKIKPSTERKHLYIQEGTCI